MLPSPLQAGRFNTFLRRLFSTKGGELLHGISDQVQVGLDLSQGMSFENRYLLGVRSWAATVALGAGGAANRNWCYFTNPAGSGVVAVIEGFASSPSAGSVTVVWGLTDSPGNGLTGLNPTLRDSRAYALSGFISQQSALTIGYINTAGAIPAGTGVQRNILAHASTDGQFDIPVVLFPGITFFYAGLTNAAEDLGVWWYERAAEKSELGSA